VGQYGHCNGTLYFRTPTGVIKATPETAGNSGPDWATDWSLDDLITAVTTRTYTNTVNTEFTFLREVLDDEEAEVELLGSITLNDTNTRTDVTRSGFPADVCMNIGFGRYDSGNIYASIMYGNVTATANSTTSSMVLNWEERDAHWDGPKYDSFGSTASGGTSFDTSCIFDGVVEGLARFTPRHTLTPTYGESDTINPDMLFREEPIDDTTQEPELEYFLWSGAEVQVNRTGGTQGIYVFPLDGVGMYVFASIGSSAGNTGACIDGASSQGTTTQVNGIPITFTTGHMLYDPASQVIVNPVLFDYKWEILSEFPVTATAVAAPASYVYTDIPPNNGVLFKSVLGPEKGYCDLQQLSYVGWVYPEEMQSNDD